jgi:hypothetical protein
MAAAFVVAVLHTTFIPADLGPFYLLCGIFFL